MIVTGVALIGASVLLCALVYLGVNRTRPSWLMSDFLVQNVWTVLAVGLLAFGVSALGQAFLGWDSRPPSGREAATAAAIAVVYALAILVLAPRRRVAAWRRARPPVTLEVIDGSGEGNSRNRDDHPDLPRAA